MFETLIQFEVPFHSFIIFKPADLPNLLPFLFSPKKRFRSIFGGVSFI